MPLSPHLLEAAFRRAVFGTHRVGDIQEARNTLRRKGWKQADVARRLEVTPVHLSYVLNGRRESRRILTAIAKLPENPNPA